MLAVFAVLLAVAASYGASVAQHLPAGGLEVTGSESDFAANEAARRFGIGAADLLVLYRNPEGDARDALFGSRIIDALEPVLEDEGVVSATTVYDTDQATLVSRDGRETLAIVSLAGDGVEKLATYRRVAPLLRAVEPSVEVQIGGTVPVSADIQRAAEEDAAAAEMVALPIALLLTLLFFRSPVAALLPILIGGFALASSSALTRFATHFTELSIFAMSVGAFLGLGLSIDYALLMVQRFREELARGLDARAAVSATLDTAGRAIWVSGLTVMLSLAALVTMPMPVLHSVSIGGVIVVACALAGALLPLPALLAWLGPAVNYWSIGRSPAEAEPSPFWRRVGELSMRHPVTAALGCTLLLGTLALPALRMRSAMPDSRVLAADSEARRVDEAISDPLRFDPGGASAIPMVVELPGPPLEPANLRALHAYVAQLERVPGVEGVRSPFAGLDPDALSPEELARKIASEPVAEKLRRLVDGNAALLVVENSNPWQSAESGALVEAVRAVPRGDLEVKVGGPTAGMVDLVDTLWRYGPVAVGLIAAWNFAVLLWAFRSVVVPLKAVLMNVLSLGASYGLLVWVFQDGHGAEWLDFEPFGGIDPTVPLVMFAVVFGLSMDYEVFLLSRIREEWLRTGDNRASVIEGLARTGRIITSAAVILLVVVGAFVAGSLVYVKQIGLGIAAAIALDVTIVRALLVPATMQLLGDWNWWAPRWLRRGASG